MATNNVTDNRCSSSFSAMDASNVRNATVGQNSPYFSMLKDRAGGVITSADYLGTIVFEGYDGTSHLIGAQIVARSTGTIAAGKIPAYLGFWTKSDTAAILAERMRIDQEGQVTINAPTSGTSLTCTAGDVRCRTVFATGDEGTGVVSQTAFTNVTDVAANSTGVFTIKSKSVNAADSTGFIKIWIGTTAYWIPVFANPAP
jgi:hypothetical protein